MKSDQKTQKLIDFIKCHHYLLICLILLPFVIYFTIVMPWDKDLDFWELAATIRSVAADPVHPENPVFNLPGNTSPRVIPYTLFLGFMMFFTRMNFIATMVFAGIMNYAIFTTGLYKFIYHKFKSRILPSILLASMFLLWGTGFHWANAYQLEVFFVHIHYVGFFVFSIGFYALYFLNRFVGENKPKYLIGYIITSAVAFVSHPITGIFIFLLAFVLAVEYKGIKRIVLLQLVPVISFLIALVWPYFKYWDVFFAGTTTQWYHSPMFGTAAVFALGPAVIGFPIALSFLLNKKYPFLTISLILSTLIFLLSAIFKIQIGERFFIFSMFLLQLIVAVYINNYFKSNPFTPLQDLKTGKLVLWLLFIIILFDTGLYRLEGFKKDLIRIKNAGTILGYQSPTESFHFIRDIFNQNHVIMADFEDAWIIPGLTGAKIVGSKRGSNPLIMEELNQRKRTVRSFYDDSLSFEERDKILKKYNVTHFILNELHQEEWDKTFLNYCSQLNDERISRNGIKIITVNTSN